MSRDTSTPAVTTMVKGRQADSARRRERVLKALADAINAAEEISVSGIAGRAGVDRTFLYRHRDLLAHVHAAEAQPRNAGDAGPAVTRASLHADLLAAQQRCARMAARTQQLEKRLSELLGEQAWRASGLGAPPTSRNCNGGSSSSNNKPSTCNCNLTNATKNLSRHAAPTANS